MNADDQRIRKQWLFLLLLLNANNFVSNWFNLKTIPYPNGFTAFYTYIISLIFLLTLGLTFLSYHCAYKKRGTKLLLFYFVATVLSFASLPYFYFTENLYTPFFYPNKETYFFVTEILGIVWATACWRIRKVNLKLKAFANQVS